MSLERIAQWVDFGKMDYRDVLSLQREFVVKREAGEIPDTILTGQHYPLIDFGSAEKHNKFSPELVENFKSEEMITRYLQSLGFDFSRTSRGGGSTYIGPGQLMVYPIVNQFAITGRKNDVSGYNLLIDRIMHEVLSRQGINVQIVEVSKELGETDPDVRLDRGDVWMRKNGKNYKLGGKGIRFSAGGIAYHGFNFYIGPESIAGFSHIEACGYPRSVLDVTSVEMETGKEIDMNRFRSQVLNSIKNHFRYSEIVPVQEAVVNG